MLEFQGTIDRIEESKAVIRTQKGQDLILPSQELNKSFKVGDAVTVSVSLAKDKTGNNEALAKNILNEIINPSS